MQDRQEMVRHLVQRVVVAVQGETERVYVAIHWAGGFVSRHEVRRPVSRVEQLRDYAELMRRVAELHGAGRTLRQIVEALNREGFHPPSGTRRTSPRWSSSCSRGRAIRSAARGGDRKGPTEGRRVVAQRPQPGAGDTPADGP